MFPVLVQCCCTNALNFASGQGRLQNVRCIKTALGRSGPDDRMNLIDKQQHISGFVQFIHDVFQSFLKLTPVLGSGNHAADVQAQHPFPQQQFRHVALHDPLGKAFRHCALSDARLADQDRIVFSPADQNLDNPHDLRFPSDHRVQFVLLCRSGQVTAEAIQQALFVSATRTSLGRSERHEAGDPSGLIFIPRVFPHLTQQLFPCGRQIDACFAE